MSMSATSRFSRARVGVTYGQAPSRISFFDCPCPMAGTPQAPSGERQQPEQAAFIEELVGLYFNFAARVLVSMSAS